MLLRIDFRGLTTAHGLKFMINVREKDCRHELGHVSLSTSSVIYICSVPPPPDMMGYGSSEWVSKASTTKFMCNLALNVLL
jgi:hypothetical protein